MKYLLCLFLLTAVTGLQAQKYITKTGNTSFKASVETFEPVEATNESTTAVLNSENGEIAALLFIKAFQFKVALMQEHFNENYMDSDQFPKATFKGKLVDFSTENLSESPSEFLLKGSLTIRGKEKQVELPLAVKHVDGCLVLDGSFTANPADFDISIPSIVRKKIAEKITIQLHYELKKKA